MTSGAGSAEEPSGEKSGDGGADPGIRQRGAFPRWGGEVDLVAMSPGGDLYAIGAKPASAVWGVTWGLAQVRFGAEMLARVIARDGSAVERLAEMLDQRRALGLSAGNGMKLKTRPRVIPVHAIGPGIVRENVRRRMVDVANALPRFDERNAMVGPSEVWRVGVDGHPGQKWRTGRSGLSLEGPWH
jgi:hypothetical protein